MKSIYIIREKYFFWGGVYMFKLKNGGCRRLTSKMGGVETSARKNGGSVDWCLEKWGGTHAWLKAAHY